MSWPIVGIVGVVLLFIFSYGVVPSPPSKPIQLSSFLDLNDTPNTYSGQAGKVPTVNGTENGLIFLSAAPTEEVKLLTEIRDALVKR